MTPSHHKFAPREVIGAIALRTRERGCMLTKTRLVKFLYLLDVLWAQENNGLTYTGWPWRFLHYGPFCSESVASITEAEKLGIVNAQEYASKYRDDAHIFMPGHASYRLDFETFIHSLPRSFEFQSLVDRFCDDTPGLLDHVYFHTEPMLKAKPGELLDFAGMKRPDYKALRPIRVGKLSDENKKKARAALLILAERMGAAASAGVRDKHFEKFVRDISEEETPTGLEGVANIKDGW